MATISLIAAMAENRVIGKDGKMPWHIPGELQIFKKYTTGKILIIGRKTHESIGKVLPNRTTIIVTRNPSYVVDGAHVVHSLDEALTLAKKLGGDVMIGGGGNLYAQTISKADFVYLTEIHKAFDGDTYFPTWTDDEFSEISREKISAPIHYDFVIYQRKR